MVKRIGHRTGAAAARAARRAAPGRCVASGFFLFNRCHLTRAVITAKRIWVGETSTSLSFSFFSSFTFFLFSDAHFFLSVLSIFIPAGLGRRIWRTSDLVCKCARERGCSFYDTRDKSRMIFFALPAITIDRTKYTSLARMFRRALDYRS